MVTSGRRGLSDPSDRVGRRAAGPRAGGASRRRRGARRATVIARGRMGPDPSQAGLDRGADRGRPPVAGRLPERGARVDHGRTPETDAIATTSETVTGAAPAGGPRTTGRARIAGATRARQNDAGQAAAAPNEGRAVRGASVTDPRRAAVLRRRPAARGDPPATPAPDAPVGDLIGDGGPTARGTGIAHLARGRSPSRQARPTDRDRSRSIADGSRSTVGERHSIVGRRRPTGSHTVVGGRRALRSDVRPTGRPSDRPRGRQVGRSFHVPSARRPCRLRRGPRCRCPMCSDPTRS
jgi:hypothetical protein